MQLPFKVRNPLIILMIVVIILNVVLWLYTFLNYKQSDDLIPLHYNIYFGINLIESRNGLFVYPFLGFIIMISSSFLMFVFQKRERLAAYFLILFALLAQVFILINEVALFVVH